MVSLISVPRLALSALLAVAGCSETAAAPSERSEPPYQVDAERPDRLLVRQDISRRLKTVEAESSGVSALITGYGRAGFAADAAYAVRVPFSSYVDRVRVAPGDRVEPGQPLAELRSSDLARLRAELSRADVGVRVKTQTAERLRALVADGTGTDVELAEAEAQLEVAQAERASARQSLAASGSTSGAGDRYTLRASAAGSVVRRNIEPGERVNPDDAPAFHIGDPSRLVMRASFSDRDARWLEEGARCSFTVDALSGERVEGTLARVVKAVNPNTRSAEALCVPSDPVSGLAAEMTARVEVSIRGGDQLLLPRSALLMKRDRWVVFVRTDDHVVERRHVLPGVAFGSAVQILDGVTLGERVVIEGAVLLDGELDVLL